MTICPNTLSRSLQYCGMMSQCSLWLPVAVIVRLIYTPFYKYWSDRSRRLADTQKPIEYVIKKKHRCIRWRKLVFTAHPTTLRPFVFLYVRNHTLLIISKRARLIQNKDASHFLVILFYWRNHFAIINKNAQSFFFLRLIPTLPNKNRLVTWCDPVNTC